MQGVVVKSTGSWYSVETTEGELVSARLRGRFRLQGKELTNPIAVGDHVRMERIEEDWLIEEILPRRNYLLRQATKLSSRYQMVASNIDQAIVIATYVQPRTSTGFIDRFLVTTAHYGIDAVILFNKSDLYGDDPGFLELVDAYQSIGYRVVVTNCVGGSIEESVSKLFYNKTSLLFGHSGVGKSTLLNGLLPNALQATGEISLSHDKGKHTTTFAEMFTLPNGAKVIDTPGVKEFGLEPMEAWKLGHYFPEFKAVLNSCKYNTCLHLNEPSCAVMAAFAEDLIAEFRYENYLNILEDIQNSAEK